MRRPTPPLCSAPPPRPICRLAPPTPIFTWTGVYLGGQVGYAWTNGHSAIDSVAYDNLGNAYYNSFYPQSNAGGVIGGAHVGYNLQINQWVLGLEGDVDGSSLNKTASSQPYSSYYLDFVPTTVHSSLSVQGSIRGRVGYAFDRLLLYWTGGVAFGGFDQSIRTDYPGCSSRTCLFGVRFSGQDSFSETRVGWTAGGGVEYAIDAHWSIRAEYRFTQYSGLGGALVNAYPAAYAGEQVNAHWNRTLNENRAQVGFSYKFDPIQPAPVVAKY
ncbi:outer membrane beta-barrel protein [Methylocapsa acidiphila]|uniref:outer membrane beta-barrel protein n=1 Tax=Methylocapsa acidiphila TaxID=133552 RepID=UPI00041904AA